MLSIMARHSSLIIMVLLFSTGLSSAESKTFVKEYIYQASELDSKVSSRTNALTQVKRLLLEEMGTYLESYTEVKNYRISKDKIIALTSGIVKTKVIDEKWDGKNYWICAELTVDSDDLLGLIRENKIKLVHEKIQIIIKDKEYRINFYSANIQPGKYGNDDSNPAPDSYILVKNDSGNILFDTGDVYVKKKDWNTLLKNRNNYNPNFNGIGFNHIFLDQCIHVYIMDWDGCEGILCRKKSLDDIIGSKHNICIGDKIGKQWVKEKGWAMEIGVFQVN